MWPTHSDEIKKKKKKNCVDFPGGSVVKNLPVNAGDMGSIPDPERSPGEENGNPLGYSFFACFFVCSAFIYLFIFNRRIIAL